MLCLVVITLSNAEVMGSEQISKTKTKDTATSCKTKHDAPLLQTKNRSLVPKSQLFKSHQKPYRRKNILHFLHENPVFKPCSLATSEEVQGHERLIDLMKMMMTMCN
jgi:hypothetical protein